MENFSQGAEWSTRYKNDLPDSAFLYIEAGGKKDSEGKIKPRSLRHFPYKDMDGKVDRAHILNAIARIPQAKFLSQAQKDRMQARARGIYLRFVKYNSKKANSCLQLISKLAAAVDLNPTNNINRMVQMMGGAPLNTTLNPTDTDNINNLLVKMDKTGSPQRDAVFMDLAMASGLCEQAQTNPAAMRDIYAHYRSLVAVNPPLTREQMVSSITHYIRSKWC
jgi:hypothetical protein